MKNDRILDDISAYFKQRTCEHLFSPYKNEWTIKGLSANIGEYKFELGEVSNKFHEFIKVPTLMVELDAEQFLLCREGYRPDYDKELKDDINRIRLQLILQIYMLEAIIQIENPNESQKARLVAWIDNCTEFCKKAVEILDRKPINRITATNESTFESKISAIRKDLLPSLMKSQKISEDGMKKAIDKMRGPV